MAAGRLFDRLWHGKRVLGGLGRFGLIGVTPETLRGALPEVLFFCFQMTFAIITPAPILGAFVERVNFTG